MVSDLGDIRKNIVHFEQLIGDLLGILSTSISFCVHSSDSISDLLMYYVNNNADSKNKSKNVIQEPSFLQKPHEEISNDNNDVDYIRFTSKGPIYCLPKRIINNLVGSFILEQCEEDQRTTDGTVYLDYPYDETMAPLLIDSLMNKSIDLSKYEYKDKYELLRLFEYCGLPLPEELVYTFNRSETKCVKCKEGDKIYLYINGIEDESICRYLMNNNLWDNYVMNYNNGFVNYYHMTENLYIDKKYKYINYIYQYIFNKYIFISSNDIISINQELFENEMYDVFGDNGRNIAKEGLTRVECFLETTIISNRWMEKYIIDWIGTEKKWKLLFRASEHEYSTSEFHKYCDNIGEKILIVKNIDQNNNVNIFGGYAYENRSNQQQNNYIGFHNNTNFLFTFNNEIANYACKYPCTNSRLRNTSLNQFGTFHNSNITTFNSFGSLPNSNTVTSSPFEFAFKDYIYISDQCHNNKDSYCSKTLCRYINNENNFVLKPATRYRKPAIDIKDNLGIYGLSQINKGLGNNVNSGFGNNKAIGFGVIQPQLSDSIVNFTVEDYEVWGIA
ncbi:hypothetical protein WA158_003407 [Blastocystis sp. Blastoise]